MVLAILLNSSCKIKNTEDIIEVREIDPKGQYTYTEIAFNPGKTAIVVVDMWGLGGCGYFNPDSSFVGPMEGFLYSEHVSKKINVLLASARALGMTVIHAPSSQIIYYESHPVRQNVKKIPETDYPWEETPVWNDDQKKIPWAEYNGEYEYMYPGMDWNRNRPGTEVYGQNPQIVPDNEDFMTDDPDELWNIIKARDIESLIYAGGSTNMCLAGRPFGLLNMQKYGLSVYLDRNYSHVIHRIPHGWNGDVKNPKYGSEYTNRQNSKEVIRYFEQNICPTLEGEDIIKLAAMKNLPVNVLKPKLEQSYPSIQDITVSFQPQHIEIPEGVVVDCGWEFTMQPNGLNYGWQVLKIKDTYRTGYDGLSEAGIHTSRNDQWSIELPSMNYSVKLSGDESGKIRIQDKVIEVGTDHDQWNIEIDFRNNNDIIRLGILTDQIKLRTVRITAVPG
jgi:nicotinamidase-related amidase